MKPFVRLSAALLALLLLCPLVSCAGGEGGTETTAPTGSISESAAESETDPFAAVNFGGRTFSVYTSVYDYGNGMGNSNFLIEGLTGESGNHVNDAVLERNRMTEELLGVRLSFTQADLDYNNVTSDVRRLLASGDHEYDMIINDLFPLAGLSLECCFLNTCDEDAVFDFDKPYWYRDFMTDASLIDGCQYLLAGDYTADVLRSVHCLLFNKQIYNDFTHRDPDELYDMVENFEWTYETMTSIVSGIYEDLNGDGRKDGGDRYGYLGCTFWGETIAFAVSAAPGFTERNEDGSVRIVLGENDRAGELGERLTALFWSEGTSINVMDYTKLLECFVGGQCLFVGNQRLGSLENALFRSRSIETGVLPYPMLRASDRRYTTAAHDTTEIGVLPATGKDMAFASTVTEVLCRETAARVIPQYYAEALQIKYVDDARAAAMIGIIHDTISESFALAYNSALGSQMLNTFAEAAQGKREFSVLYKRRAASVSKTLDKTLDAFRSKVGA